MKTSFQIELSAEDRAELSRIAHSHSASIRAARRAKIILCRADGLSKSLTAEVAGVSEVTVQTWTDRFRASGMKGLEDKAGRGRRPTIGEEVKARIIAEATRPPAGRTRHSTRTMARAVGVSHRTVRQVWSRNGIKPHLTRLFKVSKDPDFEAKFWDVIGLYLNPPEKAVVFCCDEKTQCQALERTQPGLPLGIGRVETKTHDYYRHGTTTLFAALEYLSGRVVHDHNQAHTHREWLSFLKKIWRAAPGDVSIEIIADNYATHKHEAVRRWLDKHPRIHMHYTPTSSSWMNLVEQFFGQITRDCIRDGSFTSVAELERANDLYIAQRNEHPTRIVWRADGEEILRKINKSRQALGMPCLGGKRPSET